MNFKFPHSESPLFSHDEGNFAGIRHRTIIDGKVGAAQLALWEEEHLPGFHGPLHRHDCEEIITVVNGAIEVILEGKSMTIAAGDSVLIPEWQLHEFTVLGNMPVRLLAIFGKKDPGLFGEDGVRNALPWEG